LRSRDKNVILLKNTLTSAQLYMLQSPEMDYLLIKRPTSMKFNLRPFPPIKELKNLADLYLPRFSSHRLELKNSKTNLK